LIAGGRHRGRLFDGRQQRSTGIGDLPAPTVNLKTHGLPANKSIHGNIVRVAARRPESSGAGYQFRSHHSIFLKCVESATRAKFECACRIMRAVRNAGSRIFLHRYVTSSQV
jgi:hypothetical protein